MKATNTCTHTHTYSIKPLPDWLNDWINDWLTYNSRVGWAKGRRRAWVNRGAQAHRYLPQSQHGIMCVALLFSLFPSFWIVVVIKISNNAKRKIKKKKQKSKLFVIKTIFFSFCLTICDSFSTLGYCFFYGLRFGFSCTFLRLCLRLLFGLCCPLCTLGL